MPFIKIPAIQQRGVSERIVKCRISFKTESGEFTYDGLFRSTFDAAIDAQTRAGMNPCKVSVREIK